MRKTITIILFFAAFISIAQQPVIYNSPFIDNPQIKFTRLTIENGLSNNRITDIIQDKFGYVWISTVNGLNKYNGKQFEVYTHNNDIQTTISSNFITCIKESKNHGIYIGTNNGLNIYNYLSNNFTKVNLKHSQNSEANPHVRQIMFDNDSVLWIETIAGYLIKLNINSNSIIKTYKHSTVNQKYYLYHSLYKDKDGTLWIGTRNQPPMYLDEKADKIITICADANDTSKKRANDMACYYEDSHGNFWMTALDGVYLFDKKTETFSKFLATTTYDVKEDSEGNIWFATGSGILKYNHSNGVITQMENEKDNPNSISSNSVYKIMIDAMGNKWFATNQGVNIYSSPLYAFNHFTHIPGIKNSPHGYVVTAVANNKNNNLWIGYEEDGLDFFNRKEAKFTNYLHSNISKNSIACNNVSALLLDDGGKLWIGLWRGIGFNLLNIKTKKFTLFTYNKKSLEQDWYSDFVIDEFRNFYIGFWGANGVTVFDRNKKQFSKSLKEKFKRIYCSRLLTKFTCDNNGIIWFGTTDCGVHKFSTRTNISNSYFSDDSISHGLFSNNVSDITKDKQGNIWLINDVLQKYIPENDSFISFKLPTSKLSSLVADDNGMIWIGTSSKGLFKFNPNNFSFTQYLKQDGIGSNSFTQARAKLHNGELFFGCTNGFILFNPNNIVKNTKVPMPYFGKLFIFENIVSNNLNLENEIILEHDENVFTVDLQSTELVNPERYSYQCMLVGYDKKWVNINNKQRMVRYAAVSPGTYLLKYRITNKAGVISKKTATVIFKIKHPFYSTWWFIIILITTFLILITWFIKRREYNITQKHKNLELKQRLFRLQMNPHFIFNSLIAIQNYIYNNNRKEASNYLSDFALLFRLILNNSKSEFVLFDKEIETLTLYLKFQSLRYPDKFSYNINIDPEIDVDFIMIPPMLAQPMIENAIEHGIFYKEGKGNIDIRFYYKGSELIIEVEDNGVGLSFTKHNKSKKQKHKSSALNITRERVKTLGKRHGFSPIFEITELTDNNKNVLGTKVMFNLPYKMPDVNIAEL